MKINVEGTDYPVLLGEEGMFGATIDHVWYEADTLAGLKQKVAADARRKRVSVRIPFTVAHQGQISHGVATGVHGPDGSITVRWDDAPHRPASLVDSHLVTLRRLTDDEAEQYLHLRAALWAACAAVELFERPRKIRLKAAIADALTSGTSTHVYRGVEK